MKKVAASIGNSQLITMILDLEYILNGRSQLQVQ